MLANRGITNEEILLRYLNREKEEQEAKRKEEEKRKKAEQEAQRKAEEQTKPQPSVSFPQTTNHQQQTNLSDYIFLPSENIYIAKQRSHYGLGWEQTHKTLQSQGLFMPTIPQFISCLNYLKANPNGTPDATSQEISQILDDILTARDPWRAEWLDTKFEEKTIKRKKVLYINSNHRLDQNNQLIPQIFSPLEECLMQDCYADIFNPNSQGLPTNKSKTQFYEQGKNAYYDYPRDGYVARFDADSGGAYLDCDRHPGDWYLSLGVRSSIPASEISK